MLPTNEKLYFGDNMPNIVLQQESQTTDQPDLNITSNLPISSEQAQLPTNEKSKQTINQNNSTPQMYVTRSGRTVKPNVKYSSEKWHK